MFLGHLHELLSVRWAVVSTVVCLVKNDMTGCFHFSCDGVLEFDDAVGCGKSEEGACCGMGRVDFVLSGAGLFDRDMTTEHSEVCEVRFSARQTFEGRDATRERRVGKTVLNVDRMQ